MGWYDIRLAQLTNLHLLTSARYFVLVRFCNAGGLEVL